MTSTRYRSLDLVGYLVSSRIRRRVSTLKPNRVLFSEGSAARSVFFLLQGRARVTAVSQKGKEATITILIPGDFIGEEAIAVDGWRRMVTAKTITDCTVFEIEGEDLLRLMHEEHSFSDMFLSLILERSIRTQADLIAQLFNSSEKRLARILLLMADFGRSGEPEVLIPKITQETLAEMVGTTRPRINFFMNRFRKLGFVEYNGGLRVRRSLMTVVERDRFFGAVYRSEPKDLAS
jgi:CRP/FNR family transcriptional regulator, cyclic AMP receptor protein